MPATYDTTLPTDRDWVRRLIGDVNVVTPMLQDEEIDAALAERAAHQARKYLTAADVLSFLHTLWMSRGKGVASKKVERLAIVYGTGAGINVDAAVQEKIHELRRRGAFLLSARPRPFRMI